MDTKITILLVLIACIIVLSHLGDGSTGRVRRLLPIRRWRHLMPGWRRL